MSNKPAQVLIIEPANELKFIGPFCTAVSSYMRLTNPTDRIVLFKIKTTAPKKYCVRPNCGLLEPKATNEIAIILQPFDFNAAEKNKHKFMVQSVIVPDGAEVNPESLWKEVSPDDLMDSKLRCVFELPIDSHQTSIAATVTSTAISQSANATPIKNDTGLSSMDSQLGGIGGIGGMISSEEQRLPDADLLQKIKILQAAELGLRNENMALNEQILRMRLEIENMYKEQSVSKGLGSSGTSTAGVAAAAQYQNPYSPPQLATQQQIPIVYVAAAIAMAIFGLIVGKFVL